MEESSARHHHAALRMTMVIQRFRPYCSGRGVQLEESDLTSATTSISGSSCSSKCRPSRNSAWSSAIIVRIGDVIAAQLAGRSISLNHEMLSTEAPDDEARQACREAGVERFLSVTDEIRRRAANGTPLYFPLDGHFTREGQVAFADALAPRVWRILSDERA